ncbi:hypothetical protein K504DRAFT_473321 [Pleomassaria siparia CBS 279.74]|uniref:MYND-type domain-containing protein n=1 Tax=Pleomassaria siparia CBS 279.74 TaxID=1314801 RepID=A0A6G1KP08_9PLEO|nr:hypothetical protein K504DRAFT_473321 [Pleomassaria siparia CBS 279.74]
MDTDILHLDDFRIPDYPDAALTLNGQPLAIITSAANFTVSAEEKEEDKKASPLLLLLNVPIGIATVLYHWHPSALCAFLDLDAWFSLTWIVRLADSRIEIGRVASQITIGTLDADGEKWRLMLTFNLSEEEGGIWVPNPRESMRGEIDITDVHEIESLGLEFVRDLVANRRWEAGRKTTHEFFVEYAPMDVFGDGIRMSPHWLYRGLDLNECTTCARTGGALRLDRCGRCGTAAYCSADCQKTDWKVHKGICGLDTLERGQMLMITQKGGLIRWDEERTMVKEDGVESANPHFAEKQFKRKRRAKTVTRMACPPKIDSKSAHQNRKCFKIREGNE